MEALLCWVPEIQSENQYNGPELFNMETETENKNLTECVLKHSLVFLSKKEKK
jgi:hypothetical protein